MSSVMKATPSSTTSWFQAEMTLNRGSVTIEDAVQIEGSNPPIVGIVTGLWNRDKSSVGRITKEGLFGTRLIVRIEGIDPGWFRTSLTLVPAPVGVVPSAQPPAQTSAFDDQLATAAQLPEVAQQLLRPTQGNADTTTVQTTTALASGTVYTSKTSTNSYTFNVTHAGQPIQTYDQQTADGIGPILLAVGDDPAAVVQTLQQWCGMDPERAQEYLSTIPAPIPDLYPLNEDFIDGLATAFRQAGAEVLAPGPDSSLRALARQAASMFNNHTGQAGT